MTGVEVTLIADMIFLVGLIFALVVGDWPL
jgi:hypothetical protein